MAFDEFTQFIGSFISSLRPNKDETVADPSEKESMLNEADREQSSRHDDDRDGGDGDIRERMLSQKHPYSSEHGVDYDDTGIDTPEGAEDLETIQEGQVLHLPPSPLYNTDSEHCLSEGTSYSDLSDITSSKSLPVTRRISDDHRYKLLPRSGSEILNVATRDKNHQRKIKLTQHYSPRGYYGVRAEDAEQGDISIGQEGHDDPVQSEMVDDLPLVGSEDDDDIVVENVQPADAGPSIGELEIAFQYNGEARRMNVTIIKCHNLPTKDEGGASSFRLRLLLLPSKRQRAKTHIRETQEPLFKELFRFSRIFPHEVVSTALRCRLYGCERMRKEKLIGESIIKFSSLNIGTKQIIKVRIDPRSDVSKDGSSPYSSTSDLSDSNSSSSLQSMSQGSVPEILIGLAYNATTGRLDVEVIKGSHFKQKAAGRAPDSFVKVALMSSSGFEISKSKTSVRRSQSSPTFKETFFFQVAQFQLPEMTLLFTAFNKKGVKRKETIGWFSMGLSNSSEEEIGHWNEMRESKGHQVCRWHALLES
ncbi:synaptotagmin-14-like isoform X1 [Lytechinus variegatus]|uniref:synaptotagmin-14-like isoform X1 n=1 Tax=Lytechinus variegatus TaxID=7654 RepID=UPI001BB1E905|nr:synaptotagmin-14-like isoform X1 [Lytechinus variegatus]